LLVEHFNQKFSASYGNPPKRFELEAMDVMQSYTWPGNVRELRNTVERVVIMNRKARINASDLPPLGGDAPPVAVYRFNSFKEASEAHQREFIRRKLAEADNNVTRAAELMGMEARPACEESPGRATRAAALDGQLLRVPARRPATPHQSIARHTRPGRIQSRHEGFLRCGE
jgi:transcriptional regulator with AAA-type ATPase domain